ncbi:hypothetical protein OAQ35_05065 [Litorivicinus sp.]|nr:hypothetical protein [Litorivicinus sp.]
MAYFFHCEACGYSGHEFIHPLDSLGLEPNMPEACYLCDASDQLVQQWHHPSPMTNGNHHEELMELWRVRWYPRNWEGYRTRKPHDIDYLKRLYSVLVLESRMLEYTKIENREFHDSIVESSHRVQDMVREALEIHLYQGKYELEQNVLDHFFETCMHLHKKEKLPDIEIPRVKDWEPTHCHLIRKISQKKQGETLDSNWWKTE